MKRELFESLRNLLGERERLVLVLDGRCGSGKTTLAASLAETFGAFVIHTDDFFLRPEQRSKERLREAGGNLDRERFLEEAILPLREGRAFSYRPYRCSYGDFGEEVSLPEKGFFVVEGSYSLHPYFGRYWDLSAFVSVSEKVQRERILSRPKHLHSRFFEEWIPMEERYFAGMQVKERCGTVIPVLPS